MADKLELSGPVKVEQDTAAAVAFRLTEKIASFETDKDEEKKKRGYWLSLYCQCLMAAKDYGVERVLSGK